MGSKRCAWLLGFVLAHLVGHCRSTTCVMIALDSHDDIFSGAIWPEHPSLESFRVVVTQDFWYLARFWHQFGNSFYRRPDDDVPDVAHRLAGQLHGRADASAQRLDADQRGADDLCDPGVVPGDPVLSDHADLRAVEQPLVGDPGADDVRHAVCDLHLLAVRQVDPDGARRVGAHRWRQPAADLFPDLPAADGAGAGRRRHLCAAAGVERVSVQLPDAVHAGEHDRGGRAGAVPQQRRIAVELHDGHRDHLRAAADHPVLRLPSLHGGGPDHGWREGLERHRRGNAEVRR